MDRQRGPVWYAKYRLPDGCVELAGRTDRDDAERDAERASC
jgi:hypothetical protein